MVSRVVLAYVLENAVQIKLQSTLFSLLKHVEGSAAASNTGLWQSGFSICTGMFLTSVKFVEVKVFFDIYAQCLAAFRASPDWKPVLDNDEEGLVALVARKVVV